MRCLAIPRDDAIELIESEPSVALTMLREIARRFASALPDELSVRRIGIRTRGFRSREDPEGGRFAAARL